VLSDANQNTKTGTNALASQTPGKSNTASGFGSLRSNTGGFNTASGDQSLYANSTGSNNTGIGNDALLANTSGSYNTGIGSGALSENTTGTENVANGVYAGSSITTGSNNIALGAAAGSNIVTGSQNIDIGGSGLVDESARIRIGTAGKQTATFIAGISGTPVTGAAVVITANGQLGVLASSERYKTGITSLSSEAVKLQQLRPVTFHLKTEPDGALQFGLIAEEVDRVYPDLVVRNASGQIEGLRYDELTPILLREVQEQQQALVAQDKQVATQEKQLTTQAAQLHELQQQFADMTESNRQMQAALLALQAKQSAVSMR
jgi:hypothetical protein